MSEVPEFRFRFGLRAMIIGLTVVGCAIGLLGKLMVSDFNLFTAVVLLLATVVPFLLATGTLGWIGKRTGRRGLMVWALILALAPVVGLAAVGLLQAFMDPGHGGKAFVSTRKLIAGELAQSPDDHNVWRELQRRVVTGKLSKEEVAQVATVKAKSLRIKNGERGSGQPMHNANDFFVAARERDLLPEKELLDICDAYFGTKPKFNPINAKSGTRSLALEFGTTWDSDHNHGLGVRHMWSVERVLVDGKQIELSSRNSSGGRHWHGYSKEDLPRDGKMLSAEIEVAYIDSSKLIGLSDDIPIDRWPKAIKRWKTTATIPMDGSNPELQAPKTIKLVTDPARSPMPFKVDRLVVQPDEGDLSLVVIRWKQFENKSIATSYDVLLDIGEANPISVGSMWSAPSGNGGLTYTGNQLVSRGHKIDSSIEAADIILRPNAEPLRQGVQNNSNMDVSRLGEIWGKSQTISDVTMERLDLEARSAEQ